MLKKIVNVTAVISTSVMIIYFIFSCVSIGGDISQQQIPLTDLPAILIISFICALGTVLIQDGINETTSRKKVFIHCIVHIVFLTVVVLTGGYILGWYTPSVSGVVLMLLSIAFVYAVTFFTQYYNDKNTADEVNKKIKDRDRNVK